MFNHSNVSLPPLIERAVRWLIVTPDMHRVHHSAEESETNSNFGFNLSFWDRIFGTYQAQPASGHDAMTVGLSGLRDVRLCCTVPGLLGIPFMGPVTAYAINRRRDRNSEKPEP
jgi:hypothetical protein